MSAERCAAPLTIRLLAVAVAMLAGCSPSYQELWRLTSPDGRVDAVFVEVGGGGATVGFAYNLFIVPAGGSPERGMQRLVADRIANVQGRWVANKRFELSYDAARVFNFYNFWHSRHDWKYVVEIRLVPRNESQLDAAADTLFVATVSSPRAATYASPAGTVAAQGPSTKYASPCPGQGGMLTPTAASESGPNDLN